MGMLNTQTQGLQYSGHSEVVRSVYDTQKEIILGIMRVYGLFQFDVDATYNKGAMWADLPQPAMKFDLKPITEDTVQARSSALPLADGSVGSIMYDPPFIAAKSTSGKMVKRFTAYDTIEELKEDYRASMQEFARVLQDRGILVVKCQDICYFHKNHFITVDLHRWGREFGLYQHDTYILVNKARLIDSRWKRQYRARKFHSYFLVFRKGDYVD